MSTNLPVPWVNQSNSTVDGDQVAGSKFAATNMFVNTGGAELSVVEKLAVRLHDELTKGERSPELIAKLQRYHGGIVIDGVAGLEAKLFRAGRGAELPYASDSKEQFSMILERWSYYASAQEIFVYLMARAEQKFNTEIRPLIAEKSDMEINERFNTLIVDPTVSDCGATVFKLDHNEAMGMIYWLAEQCFIRWH